MRIPLSRPEIGDREIECVTRTLRSDQLSLGPRLAEFEEKFAAFVGTRYAVGTSSGTAALHLCVKALGICPEDEVLTTSFSFVASANCLLYERAVPAFVDIHPETLNLDPIALEESIARHCTWERVRSRLINRRSGRPVRAILPVHIFGFPCDMAPILGIARDFNLRVLEDACEALGAEYAGRRAGNFGDAAAFAFYPNKQMTTAEGGMVVTNDLQIAATCRSLRNQGRDDDSGWLRHTTLGYNYRLSDLHCALGLAQLDRIEELLSARAHVAAAYSRALAGIPEISLPCETSETKRSWFVYVIELREPLGSEDRDRLMGGLRMRGIGCQAYFPPIHTQPYFRDLGHILQAPLPRTESAAARCLALPFFAALTAGQVSEVAGATREVLSQICAHVAPVRSKFAFAARASD